MSKLKKSLLPLFLAIAMLVMSVTAGAASSQTVTKLSSSKITLVYTATPYTNKAKHPKVYFDGKKLTEGTDYTAKYSDRVNAGTCTVTITGKGKYTGKVTEKFKITKQTIRGGFTSIKKGKTKTVKCWNVLKDKHVYYSSKDVSIKVVSGGKRIKVKGLKIKGLKKGKAVIKLVPKKNKSNIAAKTLTINVK